MILATVGITAYFGPTVFGQDWFHEGFAVGVILGTFTGTVFELRDAKSNARNWDTTLQRLALYAWTGQCKGT